MRTNKIYLDNVKNGIITEEMLSECLFSVNKRAKNCRDKARMYSHHYDYAQKYAVQRDKYYAQKDILLSIVNPTELHLEQVKRQDYIDERYGSPCEGDILLDIRKSWDKYLHEEYNVYVIEQTTINLYLYYKVGNNSFHSPLLFDATADQVHNIKVTYRGIPQREVDLITCGQSCDELASMQFVKKVLVLIQSDNYTYIPSSQTNLSCA